MFNKVFLIGNLTRDPELRYTASGTPVAKFGVAVNRPRRTVDGVKQEGEVDFFNVVAWQRLAEICGEYLKKGRPVAIEGRLQIRDYEKDGEKRTATEVIADNLQMLGKRSDTEGFKEESSQEKTVQSNEETSSDEIPF